MSDVTKKVIKDIILLMMSFYLLVDMAAGFSVIYMGIDLKLSLIYKLILLFLVLIIIGQYNLKYLLIITCSTLIFSIGPSYQFLKQSNINFLFDDFSILIKATTPFTVFIYFKILFKHDQKNTIKSIKCILKFSVIILVTNFCLGAVGIGKHTYALSDDQGAGSTGLIIAGNELSPTFLVVYGYALFRIWNERSTLVYLFASLITLLCGFLMATKTSMLASIVLIFMIPIVNEREELYHLTKLKIKVLLPLIVIVTAIVIAVFDILKAIGLYDRVLWFYQQRGLIGILLSGRDIMVESRLDIVFNSSSFFEQFFGQGQAISLKDRQGEVGTEVDGVDLFIQFGILPLIFFSYFYIWIMITAHKLTIKNKNEFAPYVFICSIILLFLSQVSGHIWISGTLGILLGAMSSCVYYKTPKA